jgi:hypothetical protein
MKILVPFFALILFVIGTISCRQNTSSAPASSYDYTIVPGERVGLITLEKCSREDVLAAYGDSARVEEIYLVEGMTGEGVVVFPDNPRNRMEVYWEAEIDPKRPVLIRISGEGTDWKTTQGITVGTPIAAVEKANGKPFSLFGFGWDYGGRVTNWNEGKLNNNLNIQFGYTSEGEAPAGIFGEVELSSDMPALAQLGVVVTSLELSFPRSDMMPQLQGRWQSVTDQDYQIEFEGDKLRHINGGEVSVEMTLEADPDCANNACLVTDSRPSGYCFLEKGEFDIQCNLVLYLEGNQLEYTAIGSTGKSLVFKRTE